MQEDLRRFDYPADYESWYEEMIAGNEHKVHLEQGYTFEGEAKLLNHKTQRRPNGFFIWLRWRIHPNQNRKRVIRLVRKTSRGIELLWHIPPQPNLRGEADDSWIVDDKVYVPDERFAEDENFESVFYELFFVDEHQERAALTDYRGHENMVMLPFSPIEKKT